MKKILLAFIPLFFAATAFSQFTYKIKADSVLITNDSCNAELNLENSTRDTLGFLYNKGNGRTEFRKALIKLDSVTYVIGADTLKVSSSSDSNFIKNQYLYNQSANAWFDSLKITRLTATGRTLLGGVVDDGVTPLQLKGNMSLINGIDNVGVGFDALKTISTGARNTAFGSGAGTNFYNSNANTAIGYYALHNDSSAWRNTAVGSFCLQNFKSGSTFGNTAMGHFAMEYLINGDHNVGIGTDAGGGVDTGYNNVFIGSWAGYQNNQKTKHNNDIFIGANAQYANLTPISNTTVIGTNLSTNLSNVMLLGRSDQNVLIGAPSTDNGQKLQVNGSASINDLPYLADRDTVLTYDPLTKQLKSTKISGSGSGGWSLTGNSGTNPSTNFLGTTDDSDVVFKRNGIEAFSIKKIGSNPATIKFPLVNLFGNSPEMTSNAVELQAGTYNGHPLFRINVDSSSIGPMTLNLYGVRDHLFSFTPYNNRRAGAFAIIENYGYDGLRLGSVSSLTVPHPIYFDLGRVNKMILDSLGKLGIGIATPSYLLDVNGDARISTLPFLAGRDTVLTYDPSTKQLKATKINAGGTVAKIGVINSQTKSANGAVISGDSLVMQTADASNIGLVSTGSQTFAGVKTFSSAPVISSITNTGVLTLPTITSTITGYSETPVTSNATWSPTGDARDNYYDVTAQNTAVTTINNPSGTASNHNTLLIRVKDNGTSRALTWNGSQWRAGTNLALPSTTTAGKTMYIKFIYNSADTKWDLVSVLDGF